jgi:hypothetical protein
MFDYHAKGTPSWGCASSGAAGRPRAASRAPRTPWCGARRPRSKLGQTAGAKAPPAEQRGSAASFANHTGLF